MKNNYILLACFSVSISGAFAQTVGPDPGFGNNGLVITNLRKFPGNAYCRDMLIQPDGKVIIGGELPFGKFVLRRYHPNDGALDSTFQTSEYLFVGNTYGLRLQGNDKLLFYELSRVHRLDMTGKPDSTFGNNGTIELGYISSFGTGLDFQPDGKIIAWATHNFDCCGFDFYATRITPDGMLDTTFADDGIFRFDYGYGDHDVTWASTVLSDGKILLGGITKITGWHVMLLRLHADGMIDSTFGTNGLIVTGFKNTAELHGLAVQPDEKILIAGHTRWSDSLEVVVARFTPEGMPDSTFGDFGIRYFSQLDFSYDIAVKPDNKIIFCATKDNSSIIAITQLLENGQFDPAFGDSGIYFYPYTGLVPRSLVFPDSNKIIISGTHSSPSFTGVLVGLLTDLVLDTESWGEVDQPALWAYPNPVSDVVHLRFQLEQREILNISLFDANGRALATFFSESDFEAGEHELILNIPPGTPPGIYFLQVRSEGRAAAIQLLKQ